MVQLCVTNDKTVILVGVCSLLHMMCTTINHLFVSTASSQFSTEVAQLSVGFSHTSPDVAERNISSLSVATVVLSPLRFRQNPFLCGRGTTYFRNRYNIVSRLGRSSGPDVTVTFLEVKMSIIVWEQRLSGCCKSVKLLVRSMTLASATSRSMLLMFTTSLWRGFPHDLRFTLPLLSTAIAFFRLAHAQ